MTFIRPHLTPARYLPLLLTLPLLAGCRAESEPASSAAVVPVYDDATGRLEQIVSDRDGDGRVETRAFMDGTRLVRIEIDRDGDSRVDRWEYYAASADPRAAVVERVEEAGGPDGAVTRRESYEDGVLAHVEDDTNADGRPDKWERYVDGHLRSVELDLAGRGTATRRLVYSADGRVERIEADDDGDGVFEARPSIGAAEGATP